jgi:23S rRNA pseudouridine1911/1915/1917 synthase
MIETPEIDTDPTDHANEILNFCAADDDAGIRLDAFLAARIPNWSRSRIQRLVDDGDVLLGGKLTKSSHKLKPGEAIEVELTRTDPTSFPPENIPLNVVYEDADLVVVNKPAGLVVHPGSGIAGGTLANALAFHFAELARMSQEHATSRPGIVHRLDKNTSGLMVIAKTETAHENLSEQFSTRAVFKSYVALVHGQMKDNEGQITEPIARDPKHRTRMGVVAGGRPAHSRYRVRQAFDRFSLLEVNIKTGRTHQIRVHLSWLKHPVVGDDLYGSGRDNTIADTNVRNEVAKLGRLFLHAEQLAFNHPTTGERIKFEAELPPKLIELLQVVKGDAVAA